MNGYENRHAESNRTVSSERKNYVIGVDFGTDSVRALLVEANTAEEVAVAVTNYPRWAEGRYCEAARKQFRQHPADYIESLEQAVRQVVDRCPDPASIRALAVDSTASTPCLTDRELTPLSLTKQFEDNPDAMFMLWKDHTAQQEAGQITQLCASGAINYALHSGNHYSAECYWSKVLHILRNNRKLRSEAWIALELCDWIPALLTGCRSVADLRAGHCVGGSKHLYSAYWGGYPPAEFFAALDPELAQMAARMPQKHYGCTQAAGRLSAEWAQRLGLKEGIPVGAGNIDSHSGAVGAGVGHRTMVLNFGTSACYMAVMPAEKMGDRFIEGIFGQLESSILPGLIGFEAGLSAFGDVYAWFGRLLMWPMQGLLAADSGNEQLRKAVKQIPEQLLDALGQAAAALPLREEAPLATDYLNGRRSPFPCDTLTASITGLTLATSAPEVYYALVEATAFATRAIIDHLKSGGVEVELLTGIGGISQKSPFVMQLLADVMGMEIRVADSRHACALGSVIHAAVVAGIYPTVEAAQQSLAAPTLRTYRPNSSKSEILMRRYARYRQLGAFPKTNL